MVCSLCSSSKKHSCPRCAAAVALAPVACPGEPAEYDYVIVGAGTAGAALAKLLTDDKNVSVLVVEGGLNRTLDPLVQNTEPAVLDPFVKYHWYYTARLGNVTGQGGDASQSGTLNLHTMGKMWGGSSSHNYLLAVRGVDAYGVWGAIDPQWSYDALLPLMKTIETYTAFPGQSNDPAQRGQDGPLFVTEGIAFAPPIPTLPSNGFVTAFGAGTGVSFSEDYNNPNLGRFVIGDPQFYRTPADPSVRSSSATAYLSADIIETLDNGDGLGRRGRRLYISSGSFASKLLFDDEVFDIEEQRGLGDQATVRGLRFVKGTESFEVRAKKKVILASGAINDPILLQLSGIGPASVLEAAGIPVRVANENVGRRGQNHYGPQLILPVNPAAPPPFYSTAFFDYFGPHAPPPSGLREFQTINISIDPAQQVIVVIAANLRPPHAVTVEVQSNITPAVDALIDFNIYTQPDELPKMVALLKMIADVSIAYSGQLPFVPSADAFPAAEYAAYGGTAPDDSALIAFLQASTFPLNHTSGTTRMAASADDGVVDGDLNVFGVKNLKIVSNAIFPEILDGNTAWSAYLAGVKEADIISARRCRTRC